MKFKPKSENDITSSNLWEPGEYDFEVFEAVDATSAAGNEMTKLILHVFNADAERRNVWDYLVDTEGGAFKIRHFAEAVGLLSEYERGELLAIDMINRVGRCKLNIQKDKTGQYPDKNGIADYLKPKSDRSATVQSAPRASSNARQKVQSGDIDDEIPF